jgi:hypothetical protein
MSLIGVVSWCGIRVSPLFFARCDSGLAAKERQAGIGLLALGFAVAGDGGLVFGDGGGEAVGAGAVAFGYKVEDICLRGGKRGFE